MSYLYAIICYLQKTKNSRKAMRGSTFSMTPVEKPATNLLMQKQFLKNANVSDLKKYLKPQKNALIADR